MQELHLEHESNSIPQEPAGVLDSDGSQMIRRPAQNEGDRALHTPPVFSSTSLKPLEPEVALSRELQQDRDNTLFQPGPYRASKPLQKVARSGAPDYPTAPQPIFIPAKTRTTSDDNGQVGDLFARLRHVKRKKKRGHKKGEKLSPKDARAKMAAEDDAVSEWRTIPNCADQEEQEREVAAVKLPACEDKGSDMELERRLQEAADKKQHLKRVEGQLSSECATLRSSYLGKSTMRLQSDGAVPSALFKKQKAKVCVDEMDSIAVLLE